MDIFGINQSINLTLHGTDLPYKEINLCVFHTKHFYFCVRIFPGQVRIMSEFCSKTWSEFSQNSDLLSQNLSVRALMLTITCRQLTTINQLHKFLPRSAPAELVLILALTLSQPMPPALLIRPEKYQTIPLLHGSTNPTNSAILKLSYQKNPTLTTTTTTTDYGF